MFSKRDWQLYQEFNKRLTSGIKLKTVENIEKIGQNGDILPRNDDPYMIISAGGKMAYEITVSVNSPLKSRVCLYYSFDKKPIFTEEMAYEFGPSDGGKVQRLIKFSKPVQWFRLDPVDCKTEFKINELSIEAVNQPQKNMEYESSVEKIEDFCQGYHDAPDKLILLVTQDMGMTGAPLLCAKISGQLKKMGYIPITLSLKNMEIPEYWASSADLIVSVKREEELYLIIKKLQGLGLKKAIVNTVVCGNCVPVLKENGIEVLTLIHEMRSACEILKAEAQIKKIAESSVGIVFPAQKVYEEFLSFGYPIKGKHFICPQGYYRDLYYEGEEVEYSKSLFSELGIPLTEEVFLFCGTAYFGKGIDLLPQIAKKYRERNHSGHFVWLGEFAERNMQIWIKNELKRMGLEDYVHFPGLIKEERRYCRLLQGATAFILASREDSFPSVLMEAMAVKAPVIAFRKSGGAEELLADGRGYLANYLDIDEMVSYMEAARSASDRTSEIKERAYQYVKSHMKFETYVQTLLEQF